MFRIMRSSTGELYRMDRWTREPSARPMVDILVTTFEHAVGYECGCCSAYHPAEWDGDCRDDANRIDNADLFDALIDMDDVDAWRDSLNRKEP